MKTQVLIVGGGPAGSLLSLLLQNAGIETVTLEIRSKAHVLSRIRAGVLEQGSVALLDRCGLSERLSTEGLVHDGIWIANGQERFRIDFRALVDRSVVIYGQTEVQRDLYDALDSNEDWLFDEVSALTISDIDSSPNVSFEHGGIRREIEADFVIGCDGAHGICRTLIPASKRQTYERTYPFGWLGLLADTRPVEDELVYVASARGFALCSMRSTSRSRYYLQCPTDTSVAEWSDDRFWNEMRARLPRELADRLDTGPSLEKSVTPLRSVVSEPMRYGRLLLAGDAAHVVPPTGAKGLNLAFSDVSYLADALIDHYRGSSHGLDAYSDRALRRVWKAVRFSWWMTTMLHRLTEGGAFDDRLRRTELDYLSSSQRAQALLAENYVGLPL